MENVNVILAANILKYRKKSGLSQDELAQKLGVTFQAVSKWENAKAAPDIAFLPMMADVFECSIDDLFSYMPKSLKGELNIFPGDSVPDGMKRYIGDQIKLQLDNNGSTNKFLEVMAENLSGSFELTDENIERLLEAYREMYRGIRNKKK
ncbi:MAG: helix-turn-helix domain-containing protein [Clostridia bacterium]|nr:helix-turn-helix domain-containing protein [Clostridia bacterium]